MKFSAVVLFHNRNSLQMLDYTCVTDALLSGGVFLDELLFLPYDDLSAQKKAYLRLKGEGGLIVLIAESSLFSPLRENLERALSAHFDGDFLIAGDAFFCTVTADMDGAKTVGSRLMPQIDDLRGQSYYRMCLCTVGASSEQIRAAMEKARSVDPGLAVHARSKYGQACIEIVYDRSGTKYVLDEAMRILAEELGEFVYAVEDVSIAERLVEALKIRRRTVSVAESFTGGGIGRAIVRVPGASAVYFEGLNVYNALAKQERLGVAPFTVKQRGTVSEETAYEMAAGLLATGHCDLAVATTGVAGPDPDEKGNPAGLVYLAVGTHEQVELYRYKLAGDREEVTETAIRLALFLAYRALK